MFNLKLRREEEKKRANGYAAFHIIGFWALSQRFLQNPVTLNSLIYVNTRYHFIDYRLQIRNIQIFTNRKPKRNAKTQNLECELAIISALQTDQVLNHNDLCTLLSLYYLILDDKWLEDWR